MPCGDGGAAIVDGLQDIASGMSAMPGPAALMWQGIDARLDGTVPDHSFGQLANATLIPNAATMARVSILANQARTMAIARAEAQDDILNLVERTNAQIDRDPNGGAGDCDEEPAPEPDPQPNPNEPTPAPPDPGFRGPGPFYPGGSREGGGGTGGGDEDRDGDGIQDDEDDNDDRNPGRKEGGDPPGPPSIPFDPLVLDLDGDGVELTALTGSGIHFDLDGNGFAERTGWVAADDGLLVLDRNGNGTIDSGAELFGNASLDGFEVLRALDSNGDNQFSSLDAEFANVNVWRDLNGDGTSQSGELFTLAQLGIVSIDLTPHDVSETRSENLVQRSDTFSFADGRAGTIESIAFATDRQATEYIVPNGFEYAELSAILPTLKGFGEVRDLSVAASEDPVLLEMLRSLVIDSNGMSANAFKARVDDLVQAWVGIDPTQSGDRGAHVDYDKLAVLEAFWGQPFWEQQISPGNAAQIDQLYDQLIDGLRDASSSR